MTDIAEVDGGAGAEGHGEAKKGPNKLILIGGAVAAVLVVLGVVAFLVLGSGGEGDAVSARAVAEPNMLELPLITINLASSGESKDYLKVSIALEISDPAMVAVVEPRLPRVLDTFQVYLRELRRSDLEGSAGLYRLKEELLRRVNLAVYPATVDNILFQELLVQ